MVYGEEVYCQLNVDLAGACGGRRPGTLARSGSRASLFSGKNYAPVQSSKNWIFELVRGVLGDALFKSLGSWQVCLVSRDHLTPLSPSSPASRLLLPSHTITRLTSHVLHVDITTRDLIFRVHYSRPFFPHTRSQHHKCPARAGPSTPKRSSGARSWTPA